VPLPLPPVIVQVSCVMPVPMADQNEPAFV